MVLSRSSLPKGGVVDWVEFTRSPMRLAHFPGHIQI
jgi:hypothetical protein